MASWDTTVNIQPDYGATKESSPVVREVQFGDGYIMTAKFGLNTNLKRWNLTFSNITETQADTIENFLDARAGQESFDWTPPDQSSSSKYRCKNWRKDFPYSNLHTIRATFEEVAIP